MTDESDAPRVAGVCLHVVSLPGPGGIGCIGAAARDFIRNLRKMGVGVWQMLPAGPTAFGNSPYQSLSAFAGNELLIDIDALINEGLLNAEEAGSLASLPRETVDYDRLIPAKTSVLNVVAARFAESANRDERERFETFVRDNDAPWLHDYARFRVLKARHGQAAWPDWEKRFRRRYVRSLAKFDRDESGPIGRVKVLQYLFHRQWRDLRSFARQQGVRLLGDMPIYVASDSADAWSRPDLLQMDRDGAMTAVAGVPPDYFDADGQLWGNPLYRWRRHQKEGFRWWASRLLHAMSLTDLVRLDHFRGFESYWSVPAGAASARAGRWIKGPGDALFTALEATLGQLPIVAEDLGEITPAVIALRRRCRFPGMQVLQFAVADPRFRPADIGADCVCYTGTHDNNTTVGWFEGCGNDARNEADNRALQQRVLALTGGSAATVHLDLFRLALESRARLAVAPIQDILGLGADARLNTPGSNTGNWCWRMRDDAITAPVIAEVRRLVSKAGRSMEMIRTA